MGHAKSLQRKEEEIERMRMELGLNQDRLTLLAREAALAEEEMRCRRVTESGR